MGQEVAYELRGSGEDLLMSLRLNNLIEDVVLEEEVVDLLALFRCVGARHGVSELV